MTLQDFIAVWQAQPFRAFRVHLVRRVVTINYPLAAAVTAEMKIVAVTDDGRAETLGMEEIERLEVFGEPISLADAMSGIPPEILGRNAQLLAAAMPASSSVDGATSSARAPQDPGKVALQGLTASDGVYVVEASVSASAGGPAFTTAGTRWNLHGYDQFENGTSLYLHHRDHPETEQRVILWPPDAGTLKSFGEATSFAKLAAKLKKQDERLAQKPAKSRELSAAYFQKILAEYPLVEPDGRAEMFGGEPDDDDFDRFEIHLVPRTLANGTVVKNPCLVDVPAENFMFSLIETDWDATFVRGKRTITLKLHYADRGGQNLEVEIDPYLLTATITGIAGGLPLGFIERELRNYELYEHWDLLVGALRNGPDRLKQPDLVLPLAQEFSAEMWAGETRFPLPFLQPRFLDSKGRTLLDFRATPWAAAIVTHDEKPVVTLRWLSHERENRRANPSLDIRLDLVTHRVTCAGHEGSTSLGMIQALIRHARGLKWLGEQLPELLAKGRGVPLPG